MSDLEKAARQALEVLERCPALYKAPEAATALRRALEQPAQQEPVANPDECAADVYEHGTSMGLFAMTKEEAEQYCKAETNRTGYKHDWHYFGGRVHVLALIPQAQRKPLTNEQILHRVDTHVGGSSPSYPLDNSDWINFARAIESAHGIGEKK